MTEYVKLSTNQYSCTPTLLREAKREDSENETVKCGPALIAMSNNIEKVSIEQSRGALVPRPPEGNCAEPAVPRVHLRQGGILDGEQLARDSVELHALIGRVVKARRE